MNPTKELCRCGHLAVIHTDTIAKHHGFCANSKCPCEKYTFMRFIN